MKNINVTCPKCGSNEVRMPIIDGTRIFREKDTDSRDSVSNKVVKSTDNITYSCICDDCEHHFYVAVVVECIPKSFVVKDELSDIFKATKNELQCCE